MRSIFALALVCSAVAVASTAAGQAAPAPPPPAQGAEQGGQGQGGQGQDPGPQQGPSDDPGATPSPSAGGDMGGYSYSDKPRAHRRKRLPKSNGPVVSFPGFQETTEGGSRFFVGLSATVPVEEHKAEGTVTYVLKGASARVHNNTNALVTVHFNTPASRARLVPHGKDLHFVIDLRAPVAPTWKMVDGPDKSVVLQIDFPKGDFAGIEPKAAAKKGAPAKRRRAKGKPAPVGPSP